MNIKEITKLYKLLEKFEDAAINDKLPMDICAEEIVDIQSFKEQVGDLLNVAQEHEQP